MLQVNLILDAQDEGRQHSTCLRKKLRVYVHISVANCYTRSNISDRLLDALTFCYSTVDSAKECTARVVLTDRAGCLLSACSISDADTRSFTGRNSTGSPRGRRSAKVTSSRPKRCWKACGMEHCRIRKRPAFKEASRTHPKGYRHLKTLKLYAFPCCTFVRIHYMTFYARHMVGCCPGMQWPSRDLVDIHRKTVGRVCPRSYFNIRHDRRAGFVSTQLYWLIIKRPMGPSWDRHRRSPWLQTVGPYKKSVESPQCFRRDCHTVQETRAHSHPEGHSTRVHVSSVLQPELLVLCRKREPYVRYKPTGNHNAPVNETPCETSEIVR